MSQPIVREATGRSPSVHFDFDAGTLRLRGKSYPEDAAAFYVPLLNSLRDWLAAQTSRSISAEIALLYFNSSSAKAIINLLAMLDDAAARGNEVCIEWQYLVDDETMQEYGEEFAEDLTRAGFRLVPVESI
jgi:SiaC family regulatory phosphoprotein